MLNTIKKVANKLIGTPASRRRKRSQTSDTPIEVLEDRSLLAGNVLASVNAGGDLVLKGDNLGNGVTVQRMYSNIVVQGEDLDGGPTQINGQTSAVFPVGMGYLRHLKINMKGGADLVSVSTSFTGNVTAKMGSGQDYFAMADVDDPNFVTGNVKINLGSGSSLQSIAVVGNLSVGGNMAIKGGSGEQVATIAGVQVARKLSVSLGKGDDTLLLVGVSAGSHKLNGGGGFDVFRADSLAPWTDQTGFEEVTGL
ncbi:MAG: hypothetical protein AB8G99_00185 [Planctomycetaceae bacterium]